MRIISGFNFHPHKLDWYLERNELNEFIGNTLIDISEDYKWFNGKGVWVHEELNIKKIFDDAYLMCTQVVCSSRIRMNFQKNFSKIPSQMGIPRLIHYGSDARFDELLYSTWIAYLLLHYESKFYDQNDKAYKNICYYLEKMMKIDYEVYDDDDFRAWKAKTDEFIEKNKAKAAEFIEKNKSLDAPYRYDFKPGLVNLNFTGSEPWEKWTEGFDMDVIEEIWTDDHIRYTTILAIHDAWREHSMANADKPENKCERYADQYFFDKRNPWKNGEEKSVKPTPADIERMAEDISRLDDNGLPVAETINKEESKVDNKELVLLLKPYFRNNDDKIREFLDMAKKYAINAEKSHEVGKSRNVEKPLEEYIRSLLNDGTIPRGLDMKGFHSILFDNNLYSNKYNSFNSKLSADWHPYAQRNQ